MSLNNLCKIFGVTGKISSYNEDFNSLHLLNSNKELYNNFIEYAKQDSLSLYEALTTAQNTYYNDFKVDITTILSTSTLSLKIFRKHFLKHNIPILKGTEDSFIRASYFGGATDYYIAKAENLYYSDVNSLYPYAMLNDMPLNIIKSYNQLESKSIDLNNFFGFIKVKVIVNYPKGVDSKLINPMLACKYEGRTIFPYGTWIGTYFSEELKAMIPLGYKFEILEAIEQPLWGRINVIYFLIL